MSDLIVIALTVLVMGALGVLYIKATDSPELGIAVAGFLWRLVVALIVLVALIGAALVALFEREPATDEEEQ